jgi:hypothetical protein
LSTNADKLTENDCIELVKEIRKKKRGKTAEEIKLLTFINPITNREIPLKSPIFKSFMSKCYFKFNHNKELQKSIRKIVNIKSLVLLNKKLKDIDKVKKDAQAAQDAKRLAFEKKEEEKRLALEETKKRMKEKIPIIDEYIEGLVDEFYRCCDELIANCDKDGILKEYK